MSELKNVKRLSIDIPESEVPSGEAASDGTEVKRTLKDAKDLKESGPAKEDKADDKRKPTRRPPTLKQMASTDSENKMGGAFRIPKEKLISPSEKIPPADKILTPGSEKEIRLVLGASSVVQSSNVTEPPILNKHAISNLNKSLKAKQKIINSKEPQPKTSTLISEIVNTSPQSLVFPNNVSQASANVVTSAGDEPEADEKPKEAPVETAALSAPKKKNLKNKQNKTDFFAAKLASAVDDVDSSDSDETFVYENNNTEYDNTSTHESAAADLHSTSGGPPSSASRPGSTVPSVVDAPGALPAALAITQITDREQKDQPKEQSREQPKERESVRAESIRSSYSKLNLKEQPYFDNSYSSNHFLDLIKSRPSTHRTYSDDKVGQLPVLNPLAQHVSAFNIDLQGSTRSVNEDDRYSYDDVDDDLSNDGDYKDVDDSAKDLATVTSKQTKKNGKLSTSSKLRSTTSKLFDKKGSQPRRYSIIPDDIDIEDFDDELIYYDNNIRFPYNGTNNNSGNFHEGLPLIQNDLHPRIPHYRSLNLNFNGKKHANKAKRYMSMGPTYTRQTGTPPLNNNVSSDMFPFPYGENHQYYDLNEFDEEASFDRKDYPHMSPNSNHFFLPRKVSKNTFRRNRINCIKSFIYTVLSILVILTIGFILGFILASTKDLANVSIVSIDNPVVSQDELVFNVVVEAYNPGWFTVMIEDVEIDLFAKSGYLPDIMDLEQPTTKSTVETVLLGTVFSLEAALEFDGGFFNRDPIQQVGSIKLVSPGRNLTNFDGPSGNDTEPDNSKKWEIISKNPFDLILRGILKYNLPMTKNVKSVVVNKVGYVDPT